MRFAVNENFIGAATEFAIYDRTIHEHERAILNQSDMRVIARSARVIKNDGIVWSAAYGAGALGLKAKLPLAAAGVGDLQECHNELIGTLEPARVRPVENNSPDGTRDDNLQLFIGIDPNMV